MIPVAMTVLKDTLTLGVLKDTMTIDCCYFGGKTLDCVDGRFDYGCVDYALTSAVLNEAEIHADTLTPAALRTL